MRSLRGWIPSFLNTNRSPSLDTGGPLGSTAVTCVTSRCGLVAAFSRPEPAWNLAHGADSLSVSKAYSSRAIRTRLRRRGIRTVIPQPSDQAANRKRRGSRGGRPPAFDREAYKQRNTVERCINRIKQWRGLATRYDKTATIHLAAIFIGSAR
ncbi:hypothetical protein SUDANB38_05901 (plasmid) [Streptomyces sp. enrichment culture]